MSEVKHTVDNRTVVRVLSIVMVYIGCLALVWFARKAILLILFSGFIALAINPPVSFLASKMPRGSRGLATAVAYLFVVLTVGGFLFASIPPLIEQTGNFIDKAPEIIDDLRNGDGFVANFINEYELGDKFQDSLVEFGNKLGDFSGPVFSGLSKVGNSIVSILTIVVITFFLLVEGPQRLKAFWKIYPSEKRKHHKKLADKMYSVITGFVNGQLLVALIAAVSSLIMMLLVGVPYPIPLAFMAGLLGLIPLIGASISALVITLVALTVSATAAIIMAIFFVIYQQLENNAIQPYIQSKTLEMSPLLILLAVVIGFTSAGILGGFIAIPIAGCLRVLILDFYQGHVGKQK